MRNQTRLSDMTMKARRKFAPYGSKVQILGDHLAGIPTQEATILEPIRIYGRLKSYKVRLSTDDRVIYLPSTQIFVENVPSAGLWMGRMKKTFRRAPKSFRPYLREQIDNIIHLEEEAKDLAGTHQIEYPAPPGQTRRQEGKRRKRRRHANPVAPPPVPALQNMVPPPYGISATPPLPMRFANPDYPDKYDKPLLDTGFKFSNMKIIRNAINSGTLKQLDKELLEYGTNIAGIFALFEFLNSVFYISKPYFDFYRAAQPYFDDALSQATKSSVMKWVREKSRSFGEDSDVKEEIASDLFPEFQRAIYSLVAELSVSRVSSIQMSVTRNAAHLTGKAAYDKCANASTIDEFIDGLLEAQEIRGRVDAIALSLFQMMEDVYLMDTGRKSRAFSQRLRAATESLSTASSFIWDAQHSGTIPPQSDQPSQRLDSPSPQPPELPRESSTVRELASSRDEASSYTPQEAVIFKRFFPEADPSAYNEYASKRGSSLSRAVEEFQRHYELKSLLGAEKAYPALLKEIEQLRKELPQGARDLLAEFGLGRNVAPQYKSIEDGGAGNPYDTDSVMYRVDQLRRLAEASKPFVSELSPRIRQRRDSQTINPEDVAKIYIRVRRANDKLEKLLLVDNDNSVIPEYVEGRIPAELASTLITFLVDTVREYLNFLRNRILESPPEDDDTEDSDDAPPSASQIPQPEEPLPPPPPRIDVVDVDASGGSASLDTPPDDAPPPPPPPPIPDPTSLASPPDATVSPTGLPPVVVLNEPDAPPPPAMDLPFSFDENAGRDWWIEVGKAREQVTGAYSRNTEADEARGKFQQAFKDGGLKTSNVFATPPNPKFWGGGINEAERIARAEQYTPVNRDFWLSPEAGGVAEQMVGYPLSFDRGALLSFYRYALGGGIGTAQTLRKGKYPHRKVVELLHARLKEISDRKAGGFGAEPSVAPYVWDRANELFRLLGEYLTNSPYPSMMKSTSFADDSCQNAGPPQPPFKPPVKYPWQRYPSRDASRVPNPGPDNQGRRRTPNHPLFGLIADGIDVAAGEMGFEDAFDDLARSIDADIPEHTAIVDISEGEDSTDSGRTENQGKGRGMDTVRIPNFADFEDPRDANPMKEWKSFTETMYPYLSLSDIELVTPLIHALGVSDVAMSDRGFMGAYRKAKGSARELALVSQQQGRPIWYWWNRREGFNARHIGQVTDKKKKGNTEALWVDGKRFGLDTMPSRRHLALIAWAWTPHARRFQQWIKKNRTKLLALNKELTSGRKANPETGRVSNAKSGLSYKEKLQQIASSLPEKPVLREDERGLALLDAFGYLYGQNMPGIWVHGTPIPDQTPPIVLSRKRVGFDPRREACVTSVSRGGFYKPSERMAMVTDGVVRNLFDRDVWAAIDWKSPRAEGEAARYWVPHSRPCFPTAYDEGWLMPKTANLRELLLPPRRESYTRALSIPEGVEVSFVSPAEWKAYLWEKYSIPEELRGKTPRNRNPKSGRNKKKRATVQNIHALLDSMQKEANKLGTPMFAVVELQDGSDGASMTVLSRQKDSAVNNARGAHSWWEYRNGINPCHDRRESKKKKRRATNPPPRQQKRMYGGQLAEYLEQYDPFYLQDYGAYQVVGETVPSHTHIQKDVLYRVSPRPYGLRIQTEEDAKKNKPLILPHTGMTRGDFHTKVRIPHNVGITIIGNDPLVDKDIYRHEEFDRGALTPDNIVNVAEVWLTEPPSTLTPQTELLILPSLQESREYGLHAMLEQAELISHIRRLNAPEYPEVLAQMRNQRPLPYDAINEMLVEYLDDLRNATGVEIGEYDPVFTLPIEAVPNQAIQTIWKKARRKNGKKKG